MQRWLGLGIAGIALAACTLSQTDAERGSSVAITYCAPCHRVSSDQSRGTPPEYPGAPSFMDIAARPDTDAVRLDRFMSDLHPPMPTYYLYEDERRTVIAYILSLKNGRH